jgi:GxxExxY protein
MLEHADITEKILSSCFNVIHELGAGFIESVYQKSLLIALREEGLEVREQVPLAVYFRGQCVGEFFADIIVKDKIIVELKAIKSLLPEHQAQLINYLKATGMTVGLLVNFGNAKLEYKRLFNKNKLNGD